MSPSAFLDRGSPPCGRALDEVLGKASGLWAELLARLSSEFAPLTAAWSYSGKSHGWILRTRRRQTTVLYMVPGPGRFVASFALSDKACRAAEASELPAEVVELVRQAPKYSEGRAVRLEVRRRKDLVVVERLAAIKMAS